MAARLRTSVPIEVRDRFLTRYGAFEHALKDIGLRQTRHGAVYGDWDAMALAIERPFRKLQSAALREAIYYLLNKPPRKQIEAGGQVRWKEVVRSPGLSDTQYLFRIVARVRNNLAHGAKLAQRDLADKERDRRLVEYADRVLKASVVLDPRIRNALQSLYEPLVA